ncbi:MAG TPA: efflux transporter outer membrane subunit [Smithella sp.]|jgi:multidrug efflux system outer membrane protein|nr:efflux transporter outer membrane subunit [Smithella sp.]HNQ64485.1 efflux transporter outer membrane subunit [Smithella sp.]HOG09566.1 efflux transporter outer membrane subunit [Smithella sp.]HOS13629.1 efflux transporter outer membrane subunit [Smithella sp.]HPL48134.1 efflux transporter outer membrane subunit [Smithella sp.]
MKRTLRYAWIIMIFLATGCTLAPQYSRPDAPVPDQWPTGPAYQKTKADSIEKTVAELPWREFIPDEKLQKVIETALLNNRDLRIAALNVERARAYHGIQRAELLPSVHGLGSMYKERTPADLSSTGSAYTAERYDVNLGVASWEIDFFGRIRNLKDAALEQYLATEEAHRSAQIMLVSSIAQVYMALAADREASQMVDSTLKTQEELYRLIKKRADVGMASELDLRRAQSQVDAARGDVALYIQLVAQDENALNLLVGSPVSQELLPADLKNVTPPRDISAGLSSAVLLTRPDILAAEHRLKGANANIGAARAAFFPRITLTASAGTASDALSGLFKSGTGTWLFSPQIIVPIFDARTWHAYDVTNVEKEISIAEYEKAIQTAFRDVADALAERGTVTQRLAAQQSLVDALTVTHRLSEARYNKGVDSYLSVLDAQRSLYGAQQGLIMLRLAGINNLITLYKALGGGQDN